MRKTIYSISVIALTVLSLSCNKEREEQPKNTYSNATDFYQNNKEKEQEFVITSDEGDCIVAKKGTNSNAFFIGRKYAPSTSY